MKREIPANVKLSLLINGNSGLFAFGLLLFGLILSVSFMESLDIQATFYLRNNLELGDGRIIDVFETNTEINDVSIYGYDYVFNSPIGDLNWTSYVAGYKYDIGDKVKIEFNSEKPYIHRIRGMTNTKGGWVMILFLIPLIASMIWIAYNFFLGRRKIYIIQNGELVESKLIGKESTSLEINDRKVYKLIFEFEAKNGLSYKATSKTHKPEKLEGEKNMMVIYHKENPEQSLILDSLPWSTGIIIKEKWC